MSSSPARGSFTPSSQPLQSRSLLSRLKSPLQSKARNFTDFYIQPDDPHRQYAPGDIISGSVILKVVKPVRITHLVISLHGYAQVFKNPNSPGDSYKSYASTVGSGKGHKSGSYFGNGFASLFEDEAVLCGEGRLGEGVYHFNFELEFPSKGLPSSIDFERGTISYMLASTLTRPTTISPTTSCEAKVYLVETIDVAPVPEPKPRVISLEPISKKTRSKSSVRRRGTSDKDRSSSENADSARNGRLGELASVAEESEVPESPAPSDVSFESRLSSGAGSGTDYGIRSVNTLDTSSASQASKNMLVKEKTITATIEVLKGGFLRGDQIPIKITVNHTKHVRSLKGIIMTLYRQARVDMHPALPLAPNSKGDKAKSEDYYPKSRTGLGGLSLSSAGSSHLFRKDLSQSFAPLFVDPRTLTAEVKANVRVPDEAFPTISNVPGAMISFRYFVEVVVDIQGKLSGLDRMFPNAGLINVPATIGGASGVSRGDDASANMFSTWGGNFADTDSLRREKGVISCLFEVVIGTKDSERNGKRKQQQHESGFDEQAVHEISLDQGDTSKYPEAGDPSYYDWRPHGQYYDHYGYDQAYYDHYYDPTYRDDTPQPSYISAPLPAPEEGLSEKERLRRAEARLLPSQPPSEAGPSSPLSIHPGLQPSAPVLPEDEHSHSSYLPPTSSSRPIPSNTHTVLRLPSTSSDTRSASHSSSSPSTIIAEEQTPRSNPFQPPPSASPAPMYSASSSAHVALTDDKQELQRRRMEMERSAPPGDDDGRLFHERPPTFEMRNLRLAPSAPVLEEGDEGLVGSIGHEEGGHDGRGRGGDLPPYER
ncbi:hypothetical protein GQ43DRAFT_82 [Delitschia confertaspora ATCC 74209]|uniref:Arrestin C-terminal-like domain-containing protein n=1 Tax=Delitschia confertaspora ATCC 74209 TaxID=1513339 RepID=A0A9P4JZG5_9PLEO|nr:hypothetical protein GQ43DRAFT_82 [Delitschia confertaspora ATCC 74209]